MGRKKRFDTNCFDFDTSFKNGFVPELFCDILQKKDERETSMKPIFGKILKSLREEKCITQDMLANVLNVSRSSVANYETGVREPDIACLEDIADFFGVSVDYLLGRSDQKQQDPKLEQLAQIQKILEHTGENLALDEMQRSEKMALLDFYRFLYSPAAQNE